MGMPMSNFMLLDSLVNSNNRSLENKFANDCLEPFNLFAFILYDPMEDPDIEEELTDTFEMLDIMTGDKLLFFAICNAPESWSQTVKYRSYSGMYNWARDEFVNRNRSNKLPYSYETVYTIANDLKIPTEGLPCIVVTNDFKSRNFCYFKTSKFTIGEQLKTLGYIAMRYPEVKYNWELALQTMQDKKHNVNLCAKFAMITLGDQLGKTLASVLAYLEANSETEEVRNRARSAMIKDLHKLKNEIDNIRSMTITQNQSMNRQFDDLNLKLASNLTIAYGNNLANKYSDLDVIKDYVELESYNNLLIGKKLMSVLKTEDDIKSLGSEIDFTPTIICNCKAFEREIGLSLGHSVRKYLGIDLPSYYNKWQRGLDYKKTCIVPHEDTVPGKPRPIQFNSKLKNSDNDKKEFEWRAPAIGEMRIALETLAINDTDHKYLPAEFKDSTLQNLFDLWKKIADIRNQCAHTVNIDEDKANELAYLFEKLHKLQVFQILKMFKDTYSEK